ncbi:MAG TPA: PIG-L family deacetylase [Caldilineaceae bacterium]|nr:PIG-L family deacetylase [Caldilineaceae bacterium]
MKRRRTLLGLFAHPDDESFGPGGTLARYAAEGVQVHVIIATDGIAGSMEESVRLEDHETLAQVRSAELANAAVALGITSIWSLPYRDSGMRGTPANEHPAALIQQPMERLVNELLGYIERLQPDVIITHDPFGGYGHPDHVRCCEAMTQAFHLAVERARKRQALGDGEGYMGPQKLYYTAYDRRILRLVVRVMPLLGQDPRAMGRNKDINMVEISKWETPVHTQIDVGRYLPYKLAASRAHVTQYSGGPGWVRVLPGVLRQRMMSVESFTRAHPAPNGGIERDLFAGVR